MHRLGKLRAERERERQTEVGPKKKKKNQNPKQIQNQRGSIEIQKDGSPRKSPHAQHMGPSKQSKHARTHKCTNARARGRALALDGGNSCLAVT